jgi:hypothetical protein
VRAVRGNQWMFRVGHVADQPLRVRPELLQRESVESPFPMLKESTPVRMDLTHSAWSDIFFLGMDFPKAHEYSMSRSTSRCAVVMRRLVPRLKRICALSTNPCCVWAALTWARQPTSLIWAKSSISRATIWAC